MGGDELQAAARLASQVAVTDPIMRYAAELVLGTHPEHGSAPATVKRFVSYGASPRALQTLIRAARVHALLSGRLAVAGTDVRRVAHATLRHRVIRNFEGEAEGIQSDKLVDEIIAQVPHPGAG